MACSSVISSGSRHLCCFCLKGPDKKLSLHSFLHHGGPLQHKWGPFSDATFIFLKQLFIRLPVRTHQITCAAHCGCPPYKSCLEVAFLLDAIKAPPEQLFFQIAPGASKEPLKQSVHVLQVWSLRSLKKSVKQEQIVKNDWVFLFVNPKWKISIKNVIKHRELRALVCWSSLLDITNAVV